MTNREKIIQRAERDAMVRKKYFWQTASGSIGIHLCANGVISDNEIGMQAGRSINCFDYFLMLCIQEKVMSINKVKEIYLKTRGVNYNLNLERAAGVFSKHYYSTGVWKDWPLEHSLFGFGQYIFSKDYWRPKRGDLVFFNKKGSSSGGDFYHVALACGKEKARVISFGHKMKRSGPVETVVEEISIGEIKSSEKGIVVKFTDPAWA